MFYKGKKVLVTGGAGVIGKELIKLLKKQQAIIRCVDIKEKPKSLGEDIEYYRLDLADDRTQFLFRFEPEYVFHLAADFERSEESLEFWESNFRNNILASRNLIKKIIEAKSLEKVIFASSYLIYNKENYSDITKENIMKETDEIDPRNMTGISKLQTERDLDFFSKSDNNRFDVVSARIFRVYGKGSRDVISRWIRKILKDEKIILFSENNRFDYIFSRDVAKGLLKLGKNKDAKGIFNLSSGTPRRIIDIIDILKVELGRFNIDKIDKKIYGESSCADISRLINMTGWRPEISLEEGIKELIEFEKLRK